MQALTDEINIRIPGHVMYRELDDEAVLLDLNSGRYFGFDEVGMRMWHALLQSESLAQAVELLLRRYSADRARLHRDLADWLERLVERGLLEIHPNSDSTQ